MHARHDHPVLSVLAPAHNEQENVQPLVEEIHQSLAPAGIDYEIIIVDDGSTDETLQRLEAIMPHYLELHVLRMQPTPPGRGNGQSAAFHAGIRAARGRFIAMLDADLQNDPTDLLRLLDVLQRDQAHLVQGDRMASRQDTFIRRISSAVGRFFRWSILGDTVCDTGCSLRVMRREVALALPLEFRGMHRFIPVTARQLGYTVVEVPVKHRPRIAGKAKYGIWNRALPGLIDCFVVRWMARRRRPVAFEVVTPPRIVTIETSKEQVTSDRKQGAVS